ncbi:MAG: hypothetical protein K8I02_07905, partial [Candidatus Methylomirabilis sp.]|nr:hypothetical protein [Deltaproteobacteria bacterium]
MSFRGRLKTAAAAAATCLAATAAAQGVVPVEQQAKDLILEAKDLYRAGAADAALATLARAPEIPIAPEHPLIVMAEGTAKAIEEIREDFHAGINYYNRGAVSKALESWDSVLALDAKLVGDQPSRYAQAVAGYWSRELAFKAEDSFRKGKYE